jgi:hypothetical protein
VFLIDFHTTLALMSSAVREQGLGEVFRKKIKRECVINNRPRARWPRCTFTLAADFTLHLVVSIRLISLGSIFHCVAFLIKAHVS